MKNILINYYAIIISILFVINNIILKDLIIQGPLYHYLIIALIVINTLILTKYRKQIKGKTLALIIFLIICIFSKNVFQCIFSISNIMTLIIIGIEESNLIKIITLLIIAGIPFYLPSVLIILIILEFTANQNDIYEETHYYCKNNYEIYAYSAGAMDKFHYSIGKHYEILTIDDIIYVFYSQRKEKPKEQYDNFLKNHNCHIVGDKNANK